MTRLVPALIVFVQFVASSATSEAIEPEPVPAFEEAVRPLVVKYCAGCHGGEEPKADLNLSLYESRDAVLEDRETWENVLGMLELGGMPPEDAPQPKAEEIDQLVDWLNTALNAVDCQGEPNPGRVTVRRLNRVEYNNTVHDLLGIDFQPADDFPADDVGYGFDNIGDVLSLSPLLMDRYLRAAEHIARWAIVAETWDKPTVTRFEAERMVHAGEGGRAGDETFALYSPGRLQESYHVPFEAEFLIRVRAYGEQAGPEPAKMALRFEGREFKVFDVAAEKDSPEIYETRVALEPGSLHTELAFINDYYDADTPAKARDRNLIIDYLEMEGPLVPEARLASHQRIFACHPEGDHTADCAREIVTRLARRAFRRPVTSNELQRLLGFVEQAQQQGGRLERGVQIALQAMLVSPHFLFRIEGDPNAAAEDGIRSLNDHAIATRLSYFLWSTMPDAELFALADQGRLSESEVLESQVRRMLEDPKSKSFVENFAGQWLQLRNLDRVAPNPEQFAGFDDALRRAMRRETELFFETILREDRSILDFLDADFTFVNAKLASHYGIEGVEGDRFRRVSLSGDQRGGVLSQASILTVTSNPTRTSPVKRGKWILENILGTPPPPPPPGVQDLEESEQAKLSGSLRERMQQHRANPNCAVCHVQMDALGFGFENYDAVGAWRTSDGEFSIDASGTLPRGETFEGPAQLKRILRAKAEAFSRCLAQKMLTYALGRGLEPYDECAVEEICRELAQNDYRFSVLVLEITKSQPFLMRRVDGGEE